ncbi:MAG TPA: ABC transporter permease [Tepidisphaeraceae bacterium]|nr:ABC transporter permease [Tepidisphaeraceae bacterium]
MTFLLETFALGLKNLRLHKLRSLLTALGIIFGVAAVIIMVAIGEGTKQAARRQAEALGATNVLVRSQRPPESGEATGRTQRTLIYGVTRGDYERLQQLPGVRTVVPLRETEQKVTFGDVRATANAIGTTHRIFEVINLRLSRGELFTQLHSEQGEPVCVLGASVARQLFPFQDPLGQQVKVGTGGMSTVLLTVIGVLEPTGLRAGNEGGAIVDRDLDQDVYFPLALARTAFGDTVMTRTAGSQERKQIELSEVWLQAEAIERVEPLAAVAHNVMEQRHPRADFVVKAPIQILRNAEQTARMFTFILGAIASFALVVGGIGIMNIMLANVTERTKEIGIRRALGAKRKHITLQFLIETTVISLGGGLLGIGLGVAGAHAVPLLADLFASLTGGGRGGSYPTDITAWSVVGSFLVSGLIGVGFGLYPAVMAARMNPIEALRHE